MDRSGTQSIPEAQGLKSQHPDCNNGRVKHQEQREAQSVAQKEQSYPRDNNQSRGDREAERPKSSPYAERITRRAKEESEIKVRRQQKNKLRQSERRELIKLRRARKRRTRTVGSSYKLRDTAGNNQRTRERV